MQARTLADVLPDVRDGIALPLEEAMNLPEQDVSAEMAAVDRVNELRLDGTCGGCGETHDAANHHRANRALVEAAIRAGQLRYAAKVLETLRNRGIYTAQLVTDAIAALEEQDGG